MNTLKEVRLGKTKTQFIDGDRSKRYPKKEEYVENGVLFLNSESIKSGFLEKSSTNYISEQKYADIKKGRIAKGDTLLTTRGNGVGNSAFVSRDERGLINAQMLILRPLPSEICPKFLYYYLTSKTLQSYISNFASGSAQPQIPIRDLRKIPIFLPQVKIQKKIAAILSAYDDLIENNKRRIVLLEKMAEEIYREWFVRMRFPGHEKAKFVKGVPEGWDVATLDDLVNFTMGQSPKSEFYNETGEGLPFNQGVGTYGERFPKRMTYCSSDGRKAKKGDILFSVRAPVGRLNIADCEMIIGRGLAAISHKQNLNSYLFYLLTVAFANEDIIGNGSIFNSVGKDELAKFKLFKPEGNLIVKFEEIVSRIDRQIELLISSLKQLTSTRDLLLPRLISGKLSIEDLDIHFPPSMCEQTTTEQLELDFPHA